MTEKPKHYGCAAHYCYLTGPGSGMCTNGGCNCLRDLPTGLRLAIGRRILSLEQQVKLLESQVPGKCREYQKHEFCNNIDCPGMGISDKCKINPQMCIRTAKEFHGWLTVNGFKIVKASELTPILLAAAIKTLNDNLHLCDGDVCTLKDLRDAVAQIEPDWCRASIEG